ncbi:hypothetical protein AAY473_036279 [Plecturocebus cupreus]
MLGSGDQPVAQLFKQLDSVALGWPHCFKVLIIREPPTEITLLDQRGYHWLSNPGMGRYQGLLCGNANIVVETVNTSQAVTHRRTQNRPPPQPPTPGNITA